MAQSSEEIALSAAKAHLAQLIERGSRKNSGVTREQRLAAQEGVAQAQRALAAARREEYAVPFDVGFEPEAAVSGPLLIQSDYHAVLLFNAMKATKEGTLADAGCGIFELELCTATRFGYPNDEALEGHPLYERGLGFYGVFEVMNSSWIRTITAQNRVAFPGTPDSKQRHFIVTFHDSTFECIADGIRASLSGAGYQATAEARFREVISRG